MKIFSPFFIYFVTTSFWVDKITSKVDVTKESEVNIIYDRQVDEKTENERT